MSCFLFEETMHLISGYSHIGVVSSLHVTSVSNAFGKINDTLMASFHDSLNDYFQSYIGQAEE